MQRNNNLGRNITGINKIDTTTLLTSLTNKIVAANENGQLYGIENNIAGYLKDIDGEGTYAFSSVTIDDIDFDLNPNIVVVSNINGDLTSSTISTTKLNYLYNVSSDIQTQINNKQDTLSPTNLLNASYIGTGIISNTEFNYLDGVTSAIQTQINNKQSILWNYDAGSGTNINILSPYTSCSLNLVRSDNNTSHIEIGNTIYYQSNYIDIRDPTYTDFGFRIIRGGGLATTIIHKGTADFVFSAPEGCNTSFVNAGATILAMTSSAATIYKPLTISGSLTISTNLTVTGTTTLNTKLDCSNIGTGIISNTEFNCLDGVTSAIQTQLNNKQDILWSSNTGTSPNQNFLSPISNNSLNIVRTDTQTSYIEMGNTTNAINTFIDFRDPTYTDYGLRVWRESSLKSTIAHQGTADFSIYCLHAAPIKFLTSNSLKMSITNSLTTITNDLSLSSSLTVYNGILSYGNCTFSDDLTVQGNVLFANPLNMSYVGNADVTNTQLSYLNTLTSNVQTQINNLTFSPSNFLNAAYIGTGVVDNTEFNYLNGVTSSIQTQLNAKQSTLFTNTSGTMKLTTDYNNWDFRRWSPGGGTFRIGSDIAASTGTYSFIISDPDYNEGFEIMRYMPSSGNHNTFMYHRGVGTFYIEMANGGDFAIQNQTVQKFKVENNTTRIYNNLSLTGSLSVSNNNVLNQITNTSTATSTTALNVKYSNIATTGTNNIFVSFSNSSAVIGSIKGTGAASVSYTTTSDRRMKENIILIDPLEHYNLIKNNLNQTCEYNFISDSDENKNVGFIAQDIKNIFKYCVCGEDEDLENYGNPLSVDYGRITPLLYSALKQAITEIEILKEELNKLKLHIIS